MAFRTIRFSLSQFPVIEVRPSRASKFNHQTFSSCCFSAAAAFDVTGWNFTIAPLKSGSIAFGNRRYVWKNVPAQFATDPSKESLRSPFHSFLIVVIGSLTIFIAGLGISRFTAPSKHKSNKHEEVEMLFTDLFPSPLTGIVHCSSVQGISDLIDLPCMRTACASAGRDSPRMADSESVDFTPLHLVWKPWRFRLRIGRGFCSPGSDEFACGCRTFQCTGTRLIARLAPWRVAFF